MTTRRSIALILSPIGILLISAARLIIVANFNTTTAVTIASSGGFVNTLLGTVIPLVPVFIPYVALLLLLFRRFLLSIITFAFTAFISPTSFTVTQGLRLAKGDWHRLALDIAGYQGIAMAAVIVIIILAWVYNQSLAEGLSTVVALVVAAALLIAVPIAYLSKPIQLASTDEHRLVARATAGAYGYSGREILAVLAVAGTIYAFLTFSGALEGFSWLLIGAIAIAVTIALSPYIHYIYPAPQNQSYYTEATHAMWLPAERITLSNHSVYNGYVLSSNTKWFTVLLAHKRKIVYLHTDDIVGRSVCQPRMRAQPKQHAPLIPWLYHRPLHLTACPRRDITTSIAGGTVPPNRRHTEMPGHHPHARRVGVGTSPPPHHRRPRTAPGPHNRRAPGPPHSRSPNRRPAHQHPKHHKKGRQGGVLPVGLLYRDREWPGNRRFAGKSWPMG